MNSYFGRRWQDASRERRQGPRRVSAAAAGTPTCLRAALLLTCVALAPGAAGADALRERLAALAAEHGFVVKGLDRLADAEATPAAGDLRARLTALLDGYNYLLEGTPPHVERVIILGLKDENGGVIVVPTTSRGKHQFVKTVLQGPGPQRHTVSLLVDTGASTVVLPASMSQALGFEPDALEVRRSNTANGQVTGLAARLKEVRVGAAVAREVEVLFIDDAKLGQPGMLGLSFFERFELSIDPRNDRLLLRAQ